MRLTSSPRLDDCQPSCSGRSAAHDHRWPTSLKATRVPNTFRAPKSIRSVASSSNIVMGIPSASSSENSTDARKVKTEQKQRAQQRQRPSLLSSLASPSSAGSQSQRDSEGRSLAGRKKPLKINQDLALYRARQTRILASRASTVQERMRLLREAEADMRRCLELDPEDGRAYVILGNVLVKQRRYDEAAALYEAGSAATGGTNPYIWTAWANLIGRRDNVALARKLYDAAIVADSKHAAAYHGWGLLEKSQGEFARARDIWIKGIRELGPSAASPYLFQSLAVLAAEMDKPDEARRWFRAGTESVQGSASHAMWHAWALMEQRQKANADVVRDLYRRGLKASPRSRYIFLSFALFEAEQGNTEAARKLFQTGAYLNRQDAALVQAWALMEEQCGNLERARSLFRRASKADPKHLYVWQAWGCFEQRAGDLNAARECFQQGIWAASPRAPDVSLIFQAWAVLEREAGNAELARELFKCAIKANPKSEPSWLAWADMEEDLGQPQRAQELRGFSMQERQEVASPAGFTTLPLAERQGLLAPLFSAVAKWFQRYEEAGAGARGQIDLPEVLSRVNASDGGDVPLPEMQPQKRDKQEIAAGVSARRSD